VRDKAVIRLYLKKLLNNDVFSGDKHRIGVNSSYYLIIELYGAEPLLRTEQVLIYSRNSQLSIEPKGVLHCSKEPANFSYSQRVTKTGERETQFTQFRPFHPIHLRSILVLSNEFQWPLFFRHCDRNSITFHFSPKFAHTQQISFSFI
jgi:hypothetical protein